MPFMVNYLDPVDYGTWIIVFSISSYFNILSYGMGGSIQKHSAEAIGMGDPVYLNAVFSTTLKILTVMGLFVIALSFVFTQLGFFFVEPVYEKTFAIVVLIIGSKIGLSMPSIAYLGIMVANLRYEVQAAIEVFTILLRSLLIYIVLSSSADIVLLAVVVFLADILGKVIIVLVANRMYSDVRYQKELVSKDVLKKLLGFSLS